MKGQPQPSLLQAVKQEKRQRWMPVGDGALVQYLAGCSSQTTSSTEMSFIYKILGIQCSTNLHLYIFYVRQTVNEIFKKNCFRHFQKSFFQYLTGCSSQTTSSTKMSFIYKMLRIQCSTNLHLYIFYVRQAVNEIFLKNCASRHNITALAGSSTPT